MGKEGLWLRRGIQTVEALVSSDSRKLRPKTVKEGGVETTGRVASWRELKFQVMLIKSDHKEGSRGLQVSLRKWRSCSACKKPSPVQTGHGGTCL